MTQEKLRAVNGWVEAKAALPLADEPIKRLVHAGDALVECLKGRDREVGELYLDATVVNDALQQEVERLRRELCAISRLALGALELIPVPERAAK